MANRERGEVALEAGGTTYTLRLSTNAICELEDLLSTDEKPVSYQTFIQRLLVHSRTSDVRAFLWATLREFHPDLSLADAGDILHELGGVLGLGQKLEAILASATPDEADLKALGLEGKARPRKARTERAGIGTH